FRCALTAKANLKRTIAADKQDAAAQKATDQAAINAVKAQRKLDKGNAGALATDKANLAAAKLTLKTNVAAAKAKQKADTAAAIASIKALVTQLKADRRQLKIDRKAGL